MAATEKSLSFGRYLMARRLEQGIHLGEVAKATRIGVDMLQSIENEAHDQLPAEVFVKGFLRAYAKAIGADGDKAIALYIQHLNVHHAATRLEEEWVRSEERFWLRLFLSLGCLLCVIVLTVYVDSVWHKQTLPGQTEETPEPNQGHAAEEKAVPDSESRDGTQPGITHPVDAKAVPGPLQKPAPAVAEKPPEVMPSGEMRNSKLVLNIVAVDETWLKIIVDVHAPKEYSLKPSEQLTMEADQGFNLLIGNAAGVRLTLNGRPVPVQGKKGQVVTVQIP